MAQKPFASSKFGEVDDLTTEQQQQQQQQRCLSHNSMSEEQNGTPISRPWLTNSLASPTAYQYACSGTPSYNNTPGQSALACSLNPPALQLHATASAGHFNQATGPLAKDYSNMAHHTPSTSYYSYALYQTEPSASYNTSNQPFTPETLNHNSQNTHNDIHTICTYTYNHTSHTDIQHTITTQNLMQQHASPLWSSQNLPVWEDEGTGSVIVEAGDLEERKDDVGYSERVLKEIGTTEGPCLLEVSCMGAWANEF